MPQRLRWASPQLRIDDEEYRKASWLILFYDLVFVVTVVRLTTILDENLSWDGLGTYILLFIPVWWVWVGTTTYDHLFAVDDISHRIFVFLQMVPVVLLSVYVTEALEETSIEFAYAYILARILLTALWLRAGVRNREIWPAARRLSTGYSISILFWLVSLVTPEPGRYILWGIGLGFDLLTPMLVLGDIQRYFRSFAHLAERYGLIILIVLGETIISVVRARASAHVGLDWEFGVTGFLGMTLAFTVWWLYFDQVTERYERRRARHVFALSFGHLPLVMAIAAIGASMNFAVTGDPRNLPVEVHWLLAGSVATVLVSITILELLSQEEIPRIDLYYRIGGVLAAVIVGLTEDLTGSIALLLLLIAIMVVQIVQGQLAADVPEPQLAEGHT